MRFLVPDGATTFVDLVHGPITIEHANVEDFVILRSDGYPTYHLSVVVDDVEMKITHVVRGDDHISNTPKQVMLYQAMGAPLPAFAHVPLILGPDKKRLSKRHGATSVGEYEAGLPARSDGEFSGAARSVRPGCHNPGRMTWWESWFGEEYLELYPHRDLASARREVAFALARLDPEPMPLLDLCCGSGRHSRRPISGARRSPDRIAPGSSGSSIS